MIQEDELVAEPAAQLGDRCHLRIVSQWRHRLPRAGPAVGVVAIRRQSVDLPRNRAHLSEAFASPRPYSDATELKLQPIRVTSRKNSVLHAAGGCVLRRYRLRGRSDTPHLETECRESKFPFGGSNPSTPATSHRLPEFPIQCQRNGRRASPARAWIGFNPAFRLDQLRDRRGAQAV